LVKHWLGSFLCDFLCRFLLFVRYLELFKLLLLLIEERVLLVPRVRVYEDEQVFEDDGGVGDDEEE